MSSTLELAKKLGVVRVRKLDGSSSSNKGGDKKQSLKYLLVIDFESTCWAEKNNSPSPEIIEFPVVLLCLTTGKAVAEFHNYCMPVEQPKLSPFCTELTGITQTMVDQGVPLATCLVLFKQWVESVCKEFRLAVNGENVGKLEGELNQATCCTWSDWDLSFCLENECKRKQIRKPAFLNSWIDIRAVYRKFYNRRPQGLNGALRELGLNFQGREHSGIEDARNTAILIWRMVEGGCKLEVTGSINSVAGTVKGMQVLNKDREEESPGKNKWRNYRNTPHMIPTGRHSDIDTPIQTPAKRLKVNMTSKMMAPRTPVTPNLSTKSKLNDSGYSSPHVTNTTPSGTKFVMKTPGTTNMYKSPVQTGVTKSPVQSNLARLLETSRPHPDSTPPLCVCGRRARRRQVTRTGPNTGRIFWSCPLKGGNTRAGCSFFVWAAVVT